MNRDGGGGEFNRARDDQQSATGGGGDCRPGHWGIARCQSCGWQPDPDNVLPKPNYDDDPTEPDDVREQKALMRAMLEIEHEGE